MAAAIESQLTIEEKPTILGQTEQPEYDVGVEGVRESVVRSDTSVLSLSHEGAPRFEKIPRAMSDEFAWGLYNRIFPVKITLRVLVQLLASRRADSVDLKVLREESSAQARILGQQLARAGRSKQSKGERLFTGLPFRRSEKSAERFKDMFVGSVTKSGVPEGFPSLLRFVVLKRQGNKSVALLSKAGYSFAQLRNPILDASASDSQPKSTLSDEESDFYMSHIEGALPREWELSKRVIEGVGEGVNTTEGVDGIVKQAISDLSPALVPPTRSGVISRLNELGLVNRRQDGLRITYILTQRGEKFLKLREGVAAPR